MESVEREEARKPPRSAPRSWKSFAWLLLFLVPVFELVAHAAIVNGVPDLADFRSAARFIRSRMRPKELITAAPGWADPIVRWVLGDRISLSDAGRSDLDRYKGLWVVSIGGARSSDAPGSAPDVERAFGRVKVSHWKLRHVEVERDLVESVKHATVTLMRGGVEVPCAFRRDPMGYGGGLGAGAFVPQERFVCDPSRPFLWVGATVTEDLDLLPRRCVYQHPAGLEPVRTTFHNIAAGRTLVFYGGLYYEDERHREGGPVHVRIVARALAGQSSVTTPATQVIVGEMTHRDGDGWKRMRSSIPRSAKNYDLTIEVSAPDIQRRGFCWAATVWNDASR